MARRYDPDRRQRIVDAAIRVVSERGIDGLSHRSVAAAADVPLGSTTYHFASLDELLIAALHQVNSGPTTSVASWEGYLDQGQPLVDGLVRLLENCTATSGDRSRIRLEYDLYLAALRRERLQPVAAAWLDEMVAMLARYTKDDATARTLVALIDGLLLQLLLTGRPFDRAEVRATLERVIG
ncbi:TetR/AcrR family transcriptional regulator [Streptomyces sp. NPDC057654]|uniref:TetR/AcrR family transcriptional regulator n=1 Tax=Streptomyces sp. NPDC057654 TaxID=3346196 RepID=UPI0036B47C68